MTQTPKFYVVRYDNGDSMDVHGQRTPDGMHAAIVPADYPAPEGAKVVELTLRDWTESFVWSEVNIPAPVPSNPRTRDTLRFLPRRDRHVVSSRVSRSPRTKARFRR